MPAPLIVHQEVVAGDDYKAADGRALTWGPSQTWPDLAGATLTMVVGHDNYNLYGTLPVSWTGSVPSSPDAPPKVSLDVSGAQTAVLARDEYQYVLQAKLRDGDLVTIAQGNLSVSAQPGTETVFPPAI